MGKAVCLIRKIVQLVALGYGNWVIYRTLRYARSFLVPREVASPSTEKISREQAQYFIQELNGVFQVSNSRALCLHLYYTDVLPEILASPLFVQEKCDLYISVGTGGGIAAINAIAASGVVNGSSKTNCPSR